MDRDARGCADHVVAGQADAGNAALRQGRQLIRRLNAVFVFVLPHAELAPLRVQA